VQQASLNVQPPSAPAWAPFSSHWNSAELKGHIMTAMEYFNRQLVVHTWSYNLDKAA